MHGSAQARAPDRAMQPATGDSAVSPAQRGYTDVERSLYARRSAQALRVTR